MRARAFCARTGKSKASTAAAPARRLAATTAALLLGLGLTALLLLGGCIFLLRGDLLLNLARVRVVVVDCLVPGLDRRVGRRPRVVDVFLHAVAVVLEVGVEPLDLLIGARLAR